MKFRSGECNKSHLNFVILLYLTILKKNFLLLSNQKLRIKMHIIKLDSLNLHTPKRIKITNLEGVSFSNVQEKFFTLEHL